MVAPAVAQRAPTRLGLTLVGPARPVADLAAIAGLPDAYVELMAAWGPGRLCGVFDLPDPTAPGGRFRHLQHTLAIEGPARRLAGHWAQLTDAELAHSVVLGVDRRGLALVARSPAELVLLHPRGQVLALGTFENLVASFLLGNGLLMTHGRLFDEHAVALARRASWEWAQRYREINDLGVPASYVTELAPARAELLDALAAGDEAAADVALARALEAEVTADVLAELLGYLVTDGAHLPAAVRAGYVDQLFRMARRRMPDLVPALAIRDLRRALERGDPPPPELVAQVVALRDRPDGIFLGAPDPTEAALLETLADDPTDAHTRLVYADQLEQQGQLERAAAIRGAATPLSDADARGFTAPVGLAPIDGAARIAAHADRWRADDPDAPLDALIARIDALHPTARQGYEILFVELQRQESAWTIDLSEAVERSRARAHLLRELDDAWPQLALALRSPWDEARWALSILRDGTVRAAAPYLLSILRHPPPREPVDDKPRHLTIADSFVELGEVTHEILEEFVPYLAPDATIGERHRPRHDGFEVGILRGVAFRLLEGFGSDDRVFEAALRYFCAAHPRSERILRKRRRDPRVLAVLRAQLAVEQAHALKDDGRQLAYSPEFGLLAKYLAKLGDPDAKQAFARYQRFKRWADAAPRERY